MRTLLIVISYIVFFGFLSYYFIYPEADKNYDGIMGFISGWIHGFFYYFYWAISLFEETRITVPTTYSTTYNINWWIGFIPGTFNAFGIILSPFLAVAQMVIDKKTDQK